jgi:rhodanese-related sulfurtransferase
MNMNDLIVDTKFVMDKIGKPGWVLMDVRLAEDYGKGHIAGAVNLPAWLSKLFADDTKRQATVIPRIEKTFGEMGIGNDSRVIVYGSAASVYWTAVLFWILEAFACNSSRRKGTVQYYDGGAERWQAEGGALDRSSPAVKPAVFKATAGMKRGVKIDEVQRIVAGKSKAIIIDQDAGRVRRHGRTLAQGRLCSGSRQHRLYEELRSSDIPDASSRAAAGTVQGRAEEAQGDHLLPDGGAGLVYLSGPARPRLSGRSGLSRRVARVRQRPEAPGGERDVV